MKLITDLTENNKHSLNGNGAYELWYFDAVDENNEFSFVMIFLTGNPFSPDYSEKVMLHGIDAEYSKPDMTDYSAVSFNLYLKDRVVYSTFLEFSKTEFFEDPENKIIRIDKCFFSFDESNNRYLLNINIPESYTGSNFKAEFQFNVNADSSLINDNALTVTDGRHNWLPAATDCNVTGKIKLYNNYRRRKNEFNGRGYHDHIWGDESLSSRFSDWHRGRVISNEYSLVYYLINYPDKDKKPFKKVLLFKDGKLINELNDFSVKKSKSNNFWLLNYYSEMTIESGDLKLVVSNKRRVDNGPLYIRFLSGFNLTLKNDTIINNKTGISEFIKPDRLKSGFLKRFINKRIDRIT